MLPWDEPGWLAGATEWIDRQVSRIGDVEVVRLHPWAAVARVQTAEGLLWFKHCPPAVAFEPALTVLVEARCPALAPEVVAAEGAWLLTRDAGPALRDAVADGLPAPSWFELMPLLANVQIALAADIDDMLAVGTPDRRAETIADAYEELVERIGATPRLHALVPRARELADELGDAVPLSAAHEEVHGGNVFVRDGRTRFLDWGEAVVAHPFAGLVNSLRMAVDDLQTEPGSDELLRLRDAYLEPWTTFASLAELRPVFDAAYALGCISRALSWNRLVAGLDDDVRGPYEHTVPAWLGMWASAAEGRGRLGDPE